MLIKVDIKITYQSKKLYFNQSLLVKRLRYTFQPKAVFKRNKQIIHQGKYDTIERDLFLF